METIKLTRDCDAVQIPDGNTVTIEKGTPVDITQTLGGSYTVRAGAGLFRIGGNDADALGKEVESATTDDAGPITVDRVQAMLKNCYDPEIPVNIVDLGLVYDTAIEEDDDGASVSVKMTLTAPGCGMGPSIAADAQNKILTLPGVASAEVEIVWDPPWHQSMITPEGREVLGL